MGLTQTVAPDAEPISTDLAQEFLRLDTVDVQTDTLANAIAAAREHIEDFTGLQLMPATWQETFDGFPTDDTFFLLGRGPLRSVMEITYVDADGAEQTLAADQYIAHADQDQPVIELAPDASWPTTAARQDAVTVTYEAGFADAPSIKPALKRILLAVCAMLYDQRTPDVAKLGDKMTFVHRGLGRYRLPVHR